MDTEYRVIRAIDLIEDNLCSPISNEDIAAEAGLSLRQLYRVFQENTGDTIANYIRLRRLSEASKELVASEKNILDIALKYEFQSAEVFSRAFTRVFWNSPREFRSIGSLYNATQKGRIDGTQFEIVKNGNAASPDIVELPERHMVGYRVVQPYYGLRVEDNLEEGEDLGEKLNNQLHKVQHLVDGSEWNIAFRKNQLEHLHEIENYFAVEVSEPGKFPEDMESFTLPSCSYAVFHHEGCGTLVEFTVAQAFHWFSRSPYCLGDAPSMFRLHPGQKFSGSLYIPVSTVFTPQLRWWKGFSQGYIKKFSGKKKP